MEAAASIAGLVALADLVFRYSTKYVKSSRGARKEVEDISREIGNLSLVLHRLSFVAIRLAETQSSDGTEVPSNITLHHLYDCQDLLTRLRKRLSDAESEIGSESRFKRIQGQLKWPFSSDETKGILQDLDRQKQTIDLALGADSLKSLTLILSQQSATNSGISQVQDTVKRILDIDSKIVLDKKRKGVLGFFAKANPYSEFATNRGLRQGLTGLWLTQGPEFEAWYRTPGSKVWCSGIPGAGKSVLAAAIIDECLQRNAANPGAALAYFFCTYRDEKTQQPTSILCSLCSQLARQNENAFRILEEYYDELTSEGQLQAEASTKKLIEVLRTMCSFFDRVYLVVDGLDECKKQVEESVKCLGALLPTPNDETLNLALLSRDEVIIRDIVGDQFQHLEIEAHTEDIQLYVASELEQRIASRKLRLRDLSLKDVIMTRLIDGAKGMFRWVACQLDHLCELSSDGARRRALDKLPPTLFDTYERILIRINDSLEQNKQLVQRALMLIGSPYHAHLSLRQICEAISLQEGEVELLDEDIVDGEEVLRWCGSLVRRRRVSSWSDEVGIEFSHFSVQEYLQSDGLKDSELSAFSISRQKACHLLASLCLDYLTLKNHEPLLEGNYETMMKAMEEKDSRRPFYRHAVKCWPFYVREAGQSCCPGAMYDLFQPSKTPSFCSWVTELAAHVLSIVCRGRQSVNDWVEEYHYGFMLPFSLFRWDFTPLHMAAALGMPDLCDYLLRQGANVNSNGKFGTPLHCAIAGLGVFTFNRPTKLHMNVDIFKNVDIFNSVDIFEMIDQALGRRQSALTVQVLLKSGANPHLLFIDDKGQSDSSLSLVARWSHVESNLGIAAKLIQAGITIGEEDLAYFQQRYRSFWSRAHSSGEHSGRNAIFSLIEALGPPTSETETTARTRLYIETYDYATRLGIQGSMQLPVVQSTASSIQDDVTIRRITRCIRNNDSLQLSRLLENSESEAVRSARFGYDENKPGWTALHLAVHYRSLGALNVLLSHGHDTNVSDQDGITPAHLCDNDDILQALLQHGASTLIPDKAQETVWHYIAKNRGVNMLGLLVALDVRQQALRMVSSSNETPICAALNHKNRGAVLLLLKYCDSKDFWKSCKSVFREAIEMQSTEVIQHLQDLGIEADGIDDIAGSPLHHVPTTSTVEWIQLLKGSFPIAQRRKEDLRTPLESLLLRAVGNDTKLDHKVLEAMLPGNVLSCPKEASSLWSFVCTEVVKGVMDITMHHKSWTWLSEFVFTLIELGIMGKYEEREGSALLLFASNLVENVGKIHQAARDGLHMPESHDDWAHISPMITRIVTRTSHWDSAVDHPDITRLLSLSILHDDHEMISLLLQKGVGVHSRIEELSPFNFACFPGVPVSERSFALLLEHANPEKTIEGNEILKGYGPLHFVAGWHGKGEGYTWKLRQLLQAGVDPNLPLSHRGSPLAFHVRRGTIDTVKMLLEFGADPWARGSYPFDAPLQAICCGHHEILTEIAAIYPKSPFWHRTWVGDFAERFAGGNALHLAAFHNNTKCLEFYLDQGLLSDLECHDDKLETPMHYASRFGHCPTIKFLEARGGNIDARNCKGWTPLHFAVKGGHLGTVRTLINLGAKQQACDDGCIPLALAYARGDADMIGFLQWNYGGSQESTSPITSPAVLRTVTDAMHKAILRGDVTTCVKIHSLGCPIDVEIQDGECVTPLAVAICEQKDIRVVQWLVKSGATVSVVFPQPYQGRYASPLEAAVAHPSMNSILPELLDKHLGEGASFLHADQSPLHVAVEHHNLEGLKTLLEWLRSTYESPSAKASRPSCLARDSVSHRETFSAFVNQHHAKGTGGTALHLAAEHNDLNACTVLISSRANIEEPNNQKETPLHVAARCGSLEVAGCLLQHGARPNPLDVWAETPLMSAYRDSQWELVDLLSPYCQDVVRTNHIRENDLHFMAMNGPGPARKGASLEPFSRCLEQGASLYSRDNDGVAPVHWILASQSACHLRFLLNGDHRFLRPQEIAQWPRDWFFVDIHKLAAISKNLRLVRPFLSKHELRQISGVAEGGGHSLLCRAACWGSVEVIESLLALGLDMVENQCNDHGTPLTASVSRGHIGAVKCLVRNGATVPYDLCQPSDFEVRVVNPDFVIREWLFVGRYLERRRISNVTAEASAKIESWAGVRTARVALKWEWKRRREESIWEYACRRQGILKELRGKIVKCGGESDSGEDASGDAGDNASDEEFSDRYYCLGQERIRGAMLIY